MLSTPYIDTVRHYRSKDIIPIKHNLIKAKFNPILKVLSLVILFTSIGGVLNAQNSLSKIEVFRYYYSRHFNNMVLHSLEHGFDLDHTFGNENSWMIMKSARELALAGDTSVEKVMFRFLEQLSAQKRHFVVDYSIRELVGFYVGLSDKELFKICINFLKPDYVEINKSEDCSNTGDNTDSLFRYLLKSLTKQDREFYFSKWHSAFLRAIENKEPNVSLKTWEELYPFIKSEFENNHIEFKSNN